MRRILSGTCLAFALSVTTPALTASPDHFALVHAGTLLAVPGRAPEREMTIIVKNDRIVGVRHGYLDAAAAGLGSGADAEVIDLRDRYVLPGLMDAHVHLIDEPSFGRRSSGRGNRAGRTPAQAAVNAMVYARRTLAAGFTTVRDLGSDDQAVFAVRDAIEAGRMIGPRILVAGSALAVTGGHGDSLPLDATGDPHSRLHDGTCDGASECRQAVRYQYKLGADVIKFTSTGGFSSNTGLEPQLFPDEIEAIVSTSHLVGLKAAAHAYSATSIKQAVRAGVDSIEHGFLVDDEGLSLMRKAGTYLVPTLSASYPPPIFRIPNPESVRIRGEHRAFERALAAGVRIAFGTDAGTFAHGDNAKEFGLMVKFGMQPMDAIRSATITTADLFGLSADVGTLEAGRVADLIALAGDPLEDVARLLQVDFVMKSGRIAKQGGRMTAPFSHPPPSADF